MKRRVVAVSLGWLGISMVNDAIPAVVLPHQLLSSGQADATTLGVVTLLAIALAAAVQPIAGAWSDAVGRWPVIAAGVVVGIVGLLLMLAPETALPGAVIGLLGVSAAQAGHQPLLPEFIPTPWRGQASGVKSALDVSGAIIGFLLLAALLGSGAPVAAVVLLAALMAAPFAIAYLVLPTSRRARSHESPRILFRGPLPGGLLPLIVARFFFLLGIYAVGRFLLLFVSERLRLPPDAAAEQAGLALALLAGITVVASLPAGWLADRVGRRALMVAGGALAAIGIGLLPSAGSMPSILAFGALMALGTAAFNVASWAALSDMTAAADTGRLLGLANFGTAGAAAAAGAFGLLIDAGNAGGGASGYLLAFEIAAACTLLSGALAWKLALRLPTASLIPAEVPR